MAGDPGAQGRGASRSGSGQRGDASLSLDRIVSTAVELLDAEGVSGLTMRRLAERPANLSFVLKNLLAR